VSVLASASLVAGCGLVPIGDENTEKLSHFPDARGTTFLLERWPYDVRTAYLCLEDPGEEFTAGGPPDAAAGCVTLTVSQDDRGLAARFDVGRVPAELRDPFRVSGAPWHFAVFGSRGSSSASLVMEFLESPIPRDAGPS